MAKQKSQIYHKPLIYSPEVINNEISDEKRISEQFKTQTITNTETNSTFLKNKFLEKIGEEHPFDYDLIENTVKKFGLINAITEKITDFVIGNGIYIESKNEDLVEDLESWMKETYFKDVVRPWFKESLSKGSGYIEIAGLSNPMLSNTVKTINSTTMYVKRDKYGNVTGFNQYLGTNSQVNDKDVIPLKKEDIIQFNVNKIGSSAYGYGIIYPALKIIDEFLMAQKIIHGLTKRKANTPIHVKMGNVEKDDYPSQEDINAFGEKLTFMNEKTEWVTGPNVEMKVLDFGNIGDKFTTILDNDYKLMSYSFQVPETILGAGNVPEGLANVQMDGFRRNCKARQDEFRSVLKNQIFDKLCSKFGYDDEYQICFDDESLDEKNRRIMVLKDLLNTSISDKMKVEIERKIAYILDIDYAEIEDDTNTTVTQPGEPEPQNPSQEEPEIENPYPIGEYFNILSENLKGRYKHIEHSILHKENLNDVVLTEWVRKDYISYKEAIIQAIKDDNFEDLKANNKTELKAGYLSEDKIEKLREVMIDAFSKNKGIKSIAKDIEEKVNIPNLYEYNKHGLVKDEKGKKIKLLDKVSRTNMIAKTETVRLSAKGAGQDMKTKGVSLFRWETAEDERVCPICNSLDGNIFENKESNMPPVHVNCRCIINEVSVEEKLKMISEIIAKGLEEKKSPQEIEIELGKKLFIHNKEAARMISNYIILKEEKNGKT